MNSLLETIKAITGFKMKRKKLNEISRRRRGFISACLFNCILFQVVVSSNANSVRNFSSPETSTIPYIFAQIINSSSARPPYFKTPQDFNFKSHGSPSQTSHENTKVIPIGSATNLTAIAIVDSESVDKLQLNVSWIPPKGDRIPDYYTISATSLNTTPACSKHKKKCHEDNVNGTATWLLLPLAFSSMVDATCVILPNCSYEISVSSHPWNLEYAKYEITLPDCVENVCACEEPSQLPLPTVKITRIRTGLNVTWNLIDNRRNTTIGDQISHYEVRFGRRERMKNQAYFDFEDTKVNWTGYGSQWKEFPVNMSGVSNNAEFRAWVKLLDKRNCFGPEGNYTLYHTSTPNEQPPDQDYLFMKLMIAIVLATVCLWIVIKFTSSKMRSSQCCVKLLLASARADQTLRRQPAWPTGIRATRENRQLCTVIAVDHRRLEEKSPLYVEKEIEEARNRGDADDWEISQSSIKYGSLIGEGAFGRVYIARLDIPNHPIVAVKKLKENATLEEVSEFLDEINMLKLAGKHPHVVNLIGCCTIRQPYGVILEYAERGDLLAHLRKLRDVYLRRSNSSGFSITSSLIQPSRNPTTRPSVAETEYTLLESEINGPTKRISPLESNSDTPPTLLTNIFRFDSVNGSMVDNYLSDVTGASLESDAFASSSALLTGTPLQDTQRVLNSVELHRFALQIAKGMEHLEKKGITHRDLAARNVLIDGEGKLKISDLGLSKAGIYVTNNRRKVPLRWLAIEAIRNSYYSNKSDVWSYAVLLWEIGTLGGFPYPTLSDHQILPYLTEGRRLDKPIIVSQELYSTMIRCWIENPDQRPTFAELVTLLDADESKNKAYVDISTLKMNVSFPPTEENKAFDSK